MLERIFVIIGRVTPERWRWVLNHGGFKRYFANTGWLFAGQLFSLAVSFFVGAWLARYLGPENFGVLSYTLAFAGIFAFIADPGVGNILSRDLVQTPEKEKALLGTAFRLKIWGGAAAFSLTVISAFFLQTTPLIRFLIILFAFSFFFQAFNVISTYFQANVRAKKNVVVMMVATLISSVLKVAVILAQWGVIWIILIYVLDSVWQAIGFLLTYRRSGGRLREWLFEWPLARRLWRDSWPLMFASAVGFMNLRADQLMIGWLMGERELGFYAAAVKLVEIWYFVPGLLMNSLFPAILNARKTGAERYHRRLNNYHWLMLLIPSAIALPIGLMAGPLVQLLFGESYRASVGILQVYIWSNIGLFLSWSFMPYLMAENYVRTILIINIAALLANIVLNWLLIPAFGLSGAAWATLFSYLVFPVIAAIIRWRHERAKRAGAAV